MQVRIYINYPVSWKSGTFFINKYINIVLQISIYTLSIIWFFKQSNWFASQPIDNGHTIHIDFVLFTHSLITVNLGRYLQQSKALTTLALHQSLKWKVRYHISFILYSIVWGICKGMWNKRLCWTKVPWFSLSPIWNDVCWKFWIKPTKTYMGIAQSFFNYP